MKLHLSLFRFWSRMIAMILLQRCGFTFNLKRTVASSSLVAYVANHIYYLQ